MRNKDENLQIATEILNQLGGRAFTKMTGAKNFALVDGGLQFDLPKKAQFVKEGINRLIITLAEDDTYTVRAYKLARRGLGCELRQERECVYCDDLQSCFTEITGLDTVMPKVYQIIRRPK